MSQILVYTETKHPRLQYIIEVLQSYSDVVSFVQTQSPEAFLAWEGPHINYSKSPINPSDFFILDSKNLYQDLSAFKAPSIKKTEEGGLINLNSYTESFDLFAAIFYLLARVEEYQEFSGDKHQRFPSTASFLHRHNLLKTPLVDHWIHELYKNLEIHFQIKLSILRYQPLWSLGVDIDHFYKHKYKSIFIQVSGSCRDLVYGKFNSFAKRIQIYFGFKKDPFHQWDLFQKMAIPKNQLLYFILSGGQSKYDKNHSLGLNAIRKTLDILQSSGELALHPSYNSVINPEIIEKEKLHLESLSKQTISSSRQHYLRLKIPDTYQTLINNKIDKDYTMGYADQAGFRAGTCRPYFWYDLIRESKTNLKVFPFCCMDRTYLDYLKLDPEQSKAGIIKLFNTVKKYGGHFHLIWHNSSFDFEEEWNGWDHVLVDLINYFKQHAAEQ